jgi:hypothetical protein|tara:strand:- start:1419 stop:1550 length:132 start_codon:yes stop_codon:yes gene_type:complete
MEATPVTELIPLAAPAWLMQGGYDDLHARLTPFADDDENGLCD